MTKIRISGISNLADARAAATLPVDYIGLNLNLAQPGAISPVKVSDYLQWLSGVTVVAQVHHLNQEKALRFIELLELPFAEINFETGYEANDKIWYWIDNRIEIPSKASYVVGNLTDNKVNRFVRLNPENKTTVEAIVKAGVAGIDLHIADFKQDGETNWEELEQLCIKVKEA
ncbi:hypothetical protein GC194_00220 [bacterium]|nr:hypothetical protein [bacterium]